MNFYTRVFLLFIVSLSLSGCFSSGEWMTKSYHPAPSQAHKDCKSYAADSAQAYLDDSAAYDESSALVAVAASFALADSYRDSCMKDKGYVWVDSDDYKK